MPFYRVDYLPGGVVVQHVSQARQHVQLAVPENTVQPARASLTAICCVAASRPVKPARSAADCVASGITITPGCRPLPCGESRMPYARTRVLAEPRVGPCVPNRRMGQDTSAAE